ncbi:MAG TPA: hypothetical protein VHX38_22550 [Pseudonocardiaceae bacterium]|jgi:hypothetical protein|nr:hypothetical protein [Pseudonocardiaceae bacterium]
MQALSSIPAARVMSLRRPLLISAGISVIGLVATGLLGHILAGVFGCLGLALGLLNVRLLQRSVANATITETPSKRALAVSALSRLAVVTLVVVVIGVLSVVGVLNRWDVAGVVLGLAVFQMILTATTVGSVAGGLRQQ